MSRFAGIIKNPPLYHTCDIYCSAGCDGDPWRMTRRRRLNLIWETSLFRKRTMRNIKCGCARSMLTGRIARYFARCPIHMPDYGKEEA